LLACLLAYYFLSQHSRVYPVYTPPPSSSIRRLANVSVKLAFFSRRSADAKQVPEAGTKDATFDPFQNVPTSVPPSPEELKAEERRELLQPLNKLDCPDTFDPDTPTNAPLWDRMNKLRLQKIEVELMLRDETQTLTDQQAKLKVWISCCVSICCAVPADWHTCMADADARWGLCLPVNNCVWWSRFCCRL
jgi:hypothetical protein